MKIIKTLLLSVFAVISIVSVGFAAGEKKVERVPSALPVAAKVQQITGEVKAVNAAAKSIIITKKVGKKVIEVAVIVDDKTSIAQENEKKTLADIKVGDKAVVRYTKTDSRNIAESIVFEPAGPASQKAEPTERRAKKKKS